MWKDQKILIQLVFVGFFSTKIFYVVSNWQLDLIYFTKTMEADNNLCCENPVNTGNMCLMHHLCPCVEPLLSDYWLTANCLDWHFNWALYFYLVSCVCYVNGASRLAIYCLSYHWFYIRVIDCDRNLLCIYPWNTSLSLFHSHIHVAWHTSKREVGICFYPN